MSAITTPAIEQADREAPVLSYMCMAAALDAKGMMNAAHSLRDAAARLAAFEAREAALREALGRIAKEADNPRKFWSQRIGNIARAALSRNTDMGGGK